jgi:CDP-glucose 4,6-dehydratase
LYEDGPRYAEGWNFGPDDKDAKPVEWIVDTLCKKWGQNASYEIDKGEHPHEARYLKLDCSKAKSKLDWYPRWTVEQALERTIAWHKAHRVGKNMREFSLEQIDTYLGVNQLI